MNSGLQLQVTFFGSVLFKYLLENAAQAVQPDRPQ
jgi:hypothetical protein